VSSIIRSGQSGSITTATNQGTVREQMAALVDAVKMVGAGGAQIGPGTTINDPLSAPYVLYVNFYTGSDKFVSGSYSTGGSATQRIELQRLECGYTEARPFKTINRAIIEAGIITSKSYYEQPLGNNDLVSIILMPGASVVENGAGSSVSEWANGKVPTDAELRAFNTTSTGGIILPRGCSLVAMSSDLRKTILRPAFVPDPAPEASDTSNRRTIFKVTGTGYYWGLTFMDKVGSTSSHHLLHCFEFASQAELDEFYGKIRTAFAGTNNTGGLDPALAVTRSSEYQIVGPRPVSGSQTESTDTTTSASPYIFNCSIRSNYGLCGIFADGAKPTGFKSMVLAQFTGVSLQKDLSSWQKYVSSPTPDWTSFANYAEYISTDPDNVRMNPVRRSFHIRAINDAIMQEVSVFAIGQGIHHWTQSGGELTITNSNSNFGGCAALAEGYKSSSFVSDSSWNVGTIRVATNLSEKSNNIKQIFLGTVAGSTADNATTIVLTEDLEDGTTNPGVPQLLDKDGYSFVSGHYIWIENSRGEDYRAQLASTPWSSANPNRIVVTAAFRNENNKFPGDTILNDQGFTVGTYPSLAGARIYVRRLQDTRTVDERRYSLRCNNSTSLSRNPVRDYVLQTAPGNGGITGRISDSQLLVVASASSIAPDGAGVARSASVELRRANAANDWTSGAIYRVGDVVRKDAKSFSCKQANKDTAFDPDKWEESYAHMETSYRPEDFWKNTQPIITFNKDTDPLDASTTCGYNLTTVWSTDEDIWKQLRSGVDYLALHSLLVSLGFSASNAHTILLPKLSSTRERNPVSALDGISAPNGAANSWANWAIEFRRPSNIRLFGHAWEWAGFLNYSKSLPEYQLELSPLNKFTYYFTNKNGGRVYGSGFNEEGFVVTPQGLQDLATGQEITVENLGDRDVPIDQVEFPSSFASLTAVTANIGTLTAGSVVTTPQSWGAGFGTTLPVLPQASTTVRGAVELADSTETVALARNDLAVTPEGLGAFQDDFLDRLEFMSDAESIVYVDNSVVINGSNVATYASISNAIWTDIKANRVVHDLDNWATTAPAETSDQYKFARNVVFKTVKQAFDFINSRVPITRNTIEIRLYQSSDSNASGIVTCSYRGTANLLIAAGASATLLANGWSAEHYCGYLSIPYATLKLQQANLNITGTAAAPDTRRSNGRPVVAGSIEIVNSRVKCVSTSTNGAIIFLAATEQFSILANEAFSNKNEITVDYNSATLGRVVLASCKDLTINSRQSAINTSKTLDVALSFKRTGISAGKSQTTCFSVSESARLYIDPNNALPFSRFVLSFDFTSSQATSFDFIYAEAGFKVSEIGRFTADANNFTQINMPIAQKGSLTEVFGIRAGGPVTLTWNTFGTPSALLPNQTGFLFTLATAFNAAGLSTTASYLWEIPAGSTRYGTFLLSGLDSANISNAGTPYNPPGGTAGTGTLTDVNLSLSPGTVFSVVKNDTAVPGEITFTGSLNQQLANRIFAGPSSGSSATPSFRQLVAADLPSDVVTTTGTQTLSNKTLASPTISGSTLFPAGSAAAPGVAIGQANTGAYRITTDVFGIATGGVEALRIDGSGRIGSRSSSLGGANGAYSLAAAPTGGTNSHGIVYTPLIQTDVTGTCNVLQINPSTTVGFTLANLRHYIATQGTFSGAVTNQIGFLANSNLIGATNNYGFFSSIPTTAGRWNFYADGTAPNYFEGDIRTNTTATQRAVTANSNVTATASASSLINGLRTGTPTTAITLQVPDGTGMDAAFQDLQSNQAFEWSVINLAAATNTITVTSNTSHTVVGNMIVNANTSGRFLTRKISAGNFTTYRIA
jgi:hypothetical protein